MSDRLLFTFAELDFLMSIDPTWAKRRQVLQLPGSDSAVVQVAGMASLLVRGHAQLSGADVVVTDEVAVLTSMMRGCTEEVRLAATTDSQEMSMSTLAFSADRQVRMLNSTVGPGVVELNPLRTDADLLEMLTDIALSAINEQSGGIAIGHGDTVLQIQHQDGTWSWRTAEDQQMVPASEGEIRQQIARAFGPVLEV